MQTLRRTLGYLKPYRWRFATGLACLLISQPLQLLNPLFWKFVVDEVLLGEQPPFLAWFADSRVGLLCGVLGVMLLVQVVGALISALHRYLLGVVANRVGLDMRNQLYARMQAHSLKFFHDNRSGDLVSRATGDVERVTRLATNGVDELIGAGVQLAVVWGIIVMLTWQVAVGLLAPMTLVAVLTWRFNRKVRPLYRAARERLGRVSAKIQENISGVALIKSFAREDHEQSRVQYETRGHYDTVIEGLRARSVFSPAVQIVGFVSNMVMLGLGGYFVLTGSFTIGGLVALRGYWYRLFAPIQSLARVNDRVQRSAAAAERVFDVLDRPLEINDAPDAAALTRVEGHVAFENVTFAYSQELPPVLEGITAEVHAGQMLGIAGPSGAGKSTVLGLFMRFHDPQAGRITLDGHDLRRITQDSLRRRIALVAQEPFLFNESIRDNILFGRLEAEQEDMYHAARLANAHEFILSLPDGYETVVGERGVKLSGGQKQRICIARAFLADPRVLLLDEATASVEPESEAIIQGALVRLMSGRTSVVISHRLSMIRDAENILVIRDGRIAERGDHECLMNAGGWYARMYLMQMGQE